MHECGGLSRWIPSAMSKADKFLVVLTPEYLQCLSTSTTTECSPEELNVERLNKVQCEYTYINNILYANPKEGRTKIVLLCKGLKNNEKLSHLFGDLRLLRFPEKLDFSKDHEFRAIVETLGGQDDRDKLNSDVTLLNG